MKKIVFAGISSIAFASACFGYSNSDHEKWWAKGGLSFKKGDMTYGISVFGEKKVEKQLYLVPDSGEQLEPLQAETTENLYGSFEALGNIVEFVWNNQKKCSGYNEFLTKVKEKFVDDKQKRGLLTQQLANGLGIAALGFNRVGSEKADDENVIKAISNTFNEVNGVDCGKLKHDMEYYWSEPFGGAHWFEQVIKDGGLEDHASVMVGKVFDRSNVAKWEKGRCSFKDENGKDENLCKVDRRYVKFKMGDKEGSKVCLKETFGVYKSVLTYIGDKLSEEIKNKLQDSDITLRVTIDTTASGEKYVVLKSETATSDNASVKEKERVESVIAVLYYCAHAIREMFKDVLGTGYLSYQLSLKDSKFEQCVRDYVKLSKKAMFALWNLAFKHGEEKIIGLWKKEGELSGTGDTSDGLVEDVMKCVLGWLSDEQDDGKDKKGSAGVKIKSSNETERDRLSRFVETNLFGDFYDTDSELFYGPKKGESNNFSLRSGIIKDVICEKDSGTQTGVNSNASKDEKTDYDFVCKAFEFVKNSRTKFLVDTSELESVLTAVEGYFAAEKAKPENEESQRIDVIKLAWSTLEEKLKSAISASNDSFSEFKKKFEESVKKALAGAGKNPTSVFNSSLSAYIPERNEFEKTSEESKKRVIKLFEDFTKKMIARCCELLKEKLSNDTPSEYINDFKTFCGFLKNVWAFIDENVDEKDAFKKACCEIVTGNEVISSWVEKVVGQLGDPKNIELFERRLGITDEVLEETKSSTSSKGQDSNNDKGKAQPNEKNEEEKIDKGDINCYKILKEMSYESNGQTVGVLDGLGVKELYECVVKLSKIYKDVNTKIARSVADLVGVNSDDSGIDLGELSNDAEEEISKVVALKEQGEGEKSVSELIDNVKKVYEKAVKDRCDDKDVIERYAEIYSQVFSAEVDKEIQYADYLARLSEKEINEALQTSVEDANSPTDITKKLVGIGLIATQRRLVQKYGRDYAIAFLVGDLQSEKESCRCISRIDNLKAWISSSKLSGLVSARIGVVVDSNKICEVGKEIAEQYGQLPSVDDIKEILRLFGGCLSVKIKNGSGASGWEVKYNSDNTLASLKGSREFKTLESALSELLSQMDLCGYGWKSLETLLWGYYGKVCSNLLIVRSWLITQIAQITQSKEFKDGRFLKEKYENVIKGIDEFINKSAIYFEECGVDCLGGEVANANISFGKQVFGIGVDGFKWNGNKYNLAEFGGEVDINGSTVFGSKSGKGLGGVSLPKWWVEEEEKCENECLSIKYSAKQVELSIDTKKLISEFFRAIRGSFYGEFDKAFKGKNEEKTIGEKYKGLQKDSVIVAMSPGGQKALKDIFGDLYRYNNDIRNVLKEFWDKDKVKAIAKGFYDYFVLSIARILWKPDGGEERKKQNKTGGIFGTQRGNESANNDQTYINDAKELIEKQIINNVGLEFLEDASHKDSFVKKMCGVLKGIDDKDKQDKDILLHLKLFRYVLDVIDKSEYRKGRSYEGEIIGYLKNRPLRVALRELGCDLRFLKGIFNRGKYNDKVYLSMFNRIDARIETALYKELVSKIGGSEKIKEIDQGLKELVHILVTVDPNGYKEGGQYGNSLVCESPEKADYSKWIFDKIWNEGCRRNEVLEKRIEDVVSILDKSNKKEENREKFEEDWAKEQEQMKRAMEDKKKAAAKGETDSSDTPKVIPNSNDLPPPPPLPPAPSLNDTPAPKGGQSLGAELLDQIKQGGASIGGLKSIKKTEKRTDLENPTENKQSLTEQLANVIANRRKDIEKDDEDDNNDDDSEEWSD